MAIGSVIPAVSSRVLHEGGQGKVRQTGNLQDPEPDGSTSSPEPRLDHASVFPSGPAAGSSATALSYRNMQSESRDMQSESLRVIVNPAASDGRGYKAAMELVRLLEGRGMRCDVRRTGAPGHAAELAAEAVREGARRVVVAGGDGTMHEAVQGLLGSEDEPPPVALFPLGTGNDFHRMVGGGTTPADVAGLLEDGVVERFDVGRVQWENGERFFVNLLGVGIDVDILRCRARFKRLRGLPQYLAALLNAMVTFRAPAVDIKVEGDEEHRILARTTLSVITVGPSIGGGFKVNPSAAASDGKLDLCHFAALNALQILALVSRVIRGTHGASSFVTMCTLGSAVMRGQGGDPIWFEVDGELIHAPARELKVEVVPAALPMMVPAHA